MATQVEKLNSTGKPIIVSTGMSTEEEVDGAINILNNVEYVLACTSTYPTKDEEINLNYIKTLNKEFKHRVALELYQQTLGQVNIFNSNVNPDTF